MRILTKDEKSTLIFLTISALIATAISVYFSINTQRKNEEILVNKIQIIHTGGDIDKDFKENYDSKIGKYDFYSYNPLIKSSDIVPKDWNTIASDIAKKYHSYDTFVIVCDADTLVYTASALSFMMENLTKPVILSTGIEINMTLKLASMTKIPEVMISSDNKLIRGCRAVHKSLSHFTSPNYPFLTLQNCLRFPQEKPQIKFINPTINVIVIKVFPGMDSSSFLNLFDSKTVNGIVIEIYGSGNSPMSKNFLHTIKKLVENDVLIVAVSQCDELLFNDFHVDISLLEAGVLSGYDMTTSAAYAKVCFLLGNVENKKIISQLMEKTFRGEMTVNYPAIE
jgi:L-asparaginase